MSQAKLGTGKRFAALKEKLSHEKGVHNPGAVAAKIAREKYGNEKVNKMAQAGRKRHAK